MTVAKKATTPTTPKPKATKPEPTVVFDINSNQHYTGVATEDLIKAIKRDGYAWARPAYHLDHATRQTTVYWEYVDYDNLVPGPQDGEIRKVKLV